MRFRELPARFPAILAISGAFDLAFCRFCEITVSRRVADSTKIRLPKLIDLAAVRRGGYKTWETRYRSMTDGDFYEILRTFVGQ